MVGGGRESSSNNQEGDNNIVHTGTTRESERQRGNLHGGKKDMVAMVSRVKVL